MTWWLRVANEIAAMKALGRERPASIIPESLLQSSRRPDPVAQPHEESAFAIPTPVVETPRRDSFLRPTRKIGR